MFLYILVAVILLLVLAAVGKWFQIYVTYLNISPAGINMWFRTSV